MTDAPETDSGASVVLMLLVDGLIDARHPDPVHG